MLVENVMLKHWRLLNIVKELNEGYPSSPCLTITTLDYVIFMNVDVEFALFFVSITNAFIFNKEQCVLHLAFLPVCPCLLIPVGKELECHWRILMGTYNQLLAMELPHTKPSTLSIVIMLFHTLHQLENGLRDRRGPYNARRNREMST